MTTDQPLPSPRRGVLREFARWLLVAAIVFVLLQRLARDWPLVRGNLSDLSWAWIAAGTVPAVAYFLVRIVAWRSALASLGVRPRFLPVASVWMNGEIIRYIPGNLWSVVGRVAGALKLGATRTAVFSSMVIEAVTLVASAFGLSCVLLIGYPQFAFPGRTALLIVGAVLSAAVALRAVAAVIVRAIYRMLRRGEEPPDVRGAGAVYRGMVVAWICFALFQLTIVRALGFPVDSVVLAGIFTASWLVGYVSFVTPSGLGVREAVLTAMAIPYFGVADSILIAVLSRVAMIVIEVSLLLVVNAVNRAGRRAEQGA